ncbi:MAG TPA: hypothetical protein VIG74_05790 [Alphaproteobacteria bacterium]|jgi:hypothetical protein
MENNVYPFNYPRIKIVDNLDDFIITPFEEPVNAVVWPRRLRGDFNALADRVPVEKPANGNAVYHFNVQGVEAMASSMQADEAFAQIQSDMKMFAAHAGLNPLLRVVQEYSLDYFYNFHADIQPPDGFGRVFCCYNGETTEYVRNEDAHFLGEFQNEKDERDLPYPLYEAIPGAKTYRLQLGDLWRFASQHDKVPPFIHRAVRGEQQRLMLFCHKKRDLTPQ